MLCLAKAYGNEPLRRRVVGHGHRLVYILNPDSEDARVSNPLAGVGFPEDAVFDFDADLYDRLRAAWERGEQAELWALWQTARPFSAEMEDA